ncbi:MAG: hypothetical protein C0390_13880 [Syntrophus sp. (in: bacteria)]|nr:hypothetical protein [Syntrophus sp. (in: bacteria)]
MIFHKGSSMDDKAILNQLEELAQRVGITVRYEPLKIEGFVHTGGFCRVRGKDFVIINKKATGREKMHILIDALKRHDLSQIYVLPSLREILDVENGR